MITLKTLPASTAQAVFDQIASGLLHQKKCCAKDNHCYYRLGDLKCAAGFLISDEEYRKDLEVSGTWKDLVSDQIVPNHHWQLIYELQTVHDTAEPARWVYELAFIAKKYGLKTTILRG